MNQGHGSHRHLASALAVVALLAGCIGDAEKEGSADEGWGAKLLAFATPGGRQNVDLASELGLAGGAVIARAPAGFCIDVRASDGPRGFAVMAPCSYLSAGASEVENPGLLTIQVGRAASAFVDGEEDALAAFLPTDDGKKLLSGSGDPASVVVQETNVNGKVVEVFFGDTVPSALDGLQYSEWRAFFDVRDRVVTLSVRGYLHKPLDKAKGLSLLRQFEEAMRAGTESGDLASDAG